MPCPFKAHVFCHVLAYHLSLPLSAFSYPSEKTSSAQSSEPLPLACRLSIIHEHLAPTLSILALHRILASHKSVNILLEFWYAIQPTILPAIRMLLSDEILSFYDSQTSLLVSRPAIIENSLPPTRGQMQKDTERVSRLQPALCVHAFATAGTAGEKKKNERKTTQSTNRALATKVYFT